MARKISVDYHKSQDLGRFLDLWIKELDRGEKDAKVIFEGVANKAASLIEEQIPKKLGGRFGVFMAERTQFEIKSTQSGFHLRIYGLNESQVDGGKVGDNGKDYNLWAAYEFGANVPDRNAGSGKSMAIRKDVASIATVKKLARGFRLDGGKQGSIQALVAGLMPRIERMMNQAMKKYGKAKIASAGNKAAKKAKVKNFELLEGRVDESELDDDIKEIIRGAVDGRGIPSLGARNSKGQYTSLGKSIRKRLQ